MALNQMDCAYDIVVANELTEDMRMHYTTRQYATRRDLMESFQGEAQ